MNKILNKINNKKDKVIYQISITISHRHPTTRQWGFELYHLFLTKLNKLHLYYNALKNFKY